MKVVKTISTRVNLIQGHAFICHDFTVAIKWPPLNFQSFIAASGLCMFFVNEASLNTKITRNSRTLGKKPMKVSIIAR